MKRAFTRRQGETIMYGVLCIVLLLVVMQLWLLTATMNAFLGGDNDVLWPAALASVVCWVFNARLIRFLTRNESQPKGQSVPHG